MLALKFKKEQGLGNQLWNYVVLRSAADLNNLKFKIIDYENFKAKDFLNIEITNSEEENETKDYKHYKESAIFDSDLIKEFILALSLSGSLFAINIEPGAPEQIINSNFLLRASKIFFEL